MEKGLLTSHEETCNQKPKLCPFCNCDVTGQEFSSHTYQCGSRTKKCSFCNKNILVRGSFFEVSYFNFIQNLMTMKLSVKSVS